LMFYSAPARNQYTAIHMSLVLLRCCPLLGSDYGRNMGVGITSLYCHAPGPYIKAECVRWPFTATMRWFILGSARQQRILLLSLFFEKKK
jgi:hypothetical protein